MVGFLQQQNVEKMSLPGQVKQLNITPEKYQEILDGMIVAFFQKRKGCDTQSKTDVYCRAVLKTCLTGFHRDGRLWKNAPGIKASNTYDALAMRLRVFKYDISTGTLIIDRRTKASEKIRNIGKPDVHYPTTSLGGTDRAFNREERDGFEKFKKQFTEDFPSSATAVDNMMIERLAFLMILNKRDITNVDLSKDLTKEIKELAESLGVAGKQRASAINSERSGTLELLTIKYKETLDEHIEIETTWKLEELKMISNAVRRDTTPEFLAMSWVKILYGDKVDGKELNIENVDKFLRKNNIDV